MNIDNRLQKLNNMPEDEQVKQRISQKISEEPARKKKDIMLWKEVVLFAAIACIGLFLIITPSIKNNQAATNEIQQIYTYFSAKEGEFRARPSMQYVGMQQVKSDLTVTFFEQIDQMKVVENGQLGDHFIDVIVVKNNEKQRYQLSDLTLYDVDHQIFYAGEGKLYEDVFDALYRGKSNSITLLLPPIVILMNVIPNYYYKKRRIKLPETNKGATKYAIIAMGVLVGIFGYAYYVGPLYKPFLYVLSIGHGYFMWRVVKMNVQNLTVYKVEKWKMIILIVAILALVYNL